MAGEESVRDVPDKKSVPSQVAPPATDSPTAIPSMEDLSGRPPPEGVMHGYGMRVAPATRKRKGKSVEDYARENPFDFTTRTIVTEGGVPVQVLMCYFCCQHVGARSDRIREHLITKKHVNKKYQQLCGAAMGESDSPGDRDPPARHTMAEKANSSGEYSSSSQESPDGKKRRTPEVNEIQGDSGSPLLPPPMMKMVVGDGEYSTEEQESGGERPEIGQRPIILSSLLGPQLQLQSPYLKQLDKLIMKVNAGKPQSTHEINPLPCRDMQSSIDNVLARNVAVEKQGHAETPRMGPKLDMEGKSSSLPIPRENKSPTAAPQIKKTETITKSPKRVRKAPSVSPPKAKKSRTMNEQTFNVRWENFGFNALSAYAKFQEEGKFVDATIFCDGVSFRCHRVVLAAVSTYFLDLLLKHPQEQLPIFFVRDISRGDMATLIEFMYKGEVNLAEGQLHAFMKAAESLKIKGLTEDSKPSFSPAAAAIM